MLITCHSDQQNIAEQLRKDLSNKKFSCRVLNESTPRSIAVRANLVRWCDIFIVVTSRMYQRTLFCIETIYYAKDLRKAIIAVLGEANFQPYGGLGAISASAAGSIALGKDGVSENTVAQLSNLISAQTNKQKKIAVDPAAVYFHADLNLNFRSFSFSWKITLTA